MEKLIIEKIRTLSLPELNMVKPMHIFENLTSHYKDQMSSDSMSGLYYYMNISENSLYSFRVNNVGLGNHYYSKLGFLRETYFIGPIKHGMLSLHYALLAYKNYVEQDFEDSEKNINLAIENSIIQSQDFPYFILIIGEQSLNKIRIFARTKNKEQIIEELSYIIKLLILANNEDSISSLLKTLSLEERMSLLNHVINNSCTAIQKTYDEGEVLEIFHKISLAVASEGELLKDFENLSIGLSSFLLINNSKTEFLEFVNKNFEQLCFIPKNLLGIICKEVLKNSSEDLLSFHEQDELFIQSLKKLNIKTAYSF